MIILAILRLFTIFRFRGNGKDEELLKQYDDSFEKWVYLLLSERKMSDGC